jgi:hypothetical protein
MKSVGAGDDLYALLGAAERDVASIDIETTSAPSVVARTVFDPVVFTDTEHN